MADEVTDDTQAAPIAPGGAPVVIPVETTRASSTRVIPTPAETAALGRAVADKQAEAKAQEEVGKAAATASEFEAQGKVSEGDLLEQQAAERLALEEQQRQINATARANAEEAESKVRDFKFHDFWEGKGMGPRILAIAGRFFGGMAGANESTDAISQAIGLHFDRQKAELGNLQTIAKWKREGIQDLDGHYEKMLAGLEKRQALALRSAADKAEALAIRAKIPEETAKNNVLVLKLRGEADMLDANSNDRFARHATYEQTKGQHVATGASQNISPPLIYGPEGKPIAQVATGKLADETNKANANYRAIRAGLEELQAEVAKGPSLPGISQRGQKIAGLKARLLTQMKDQQQLGALSGPDMGLMENQLGGPLETTLGRSGPKVREAIKLLDQSHGQFLDSKGLPGQQLLPRLRGSQNPGAAAPPSSAGAAPGGTPPPAAPAAAPLTPDLVARARAKLANPNTGEAAKRKAMEVVRAARAAGVQ